MRKRASSDDQLSAPEATPAGGFREAGAAFRHAAAPQAAPDAALLALAAKCRKIEPKLAAADRELRAAEARIVEPPAPQELVATEEDLDLIWLRVTPGERFDADQVGALRKWIGGDAKGFRDEKTVWALRMVARVDEILAADIAHRRAGVAAIDAAGKTRAFTLVCGLQDRRDKMWTQATKLRAQTRAGVLAKLECVAAFCATPRDQRNVFFAMAVDLANSLLASAAADLAALLKR